MVAVHYSFSTYLEHLSCPQLIKVGSCLSFQIRFNTLIFIDFRSTHSRCMLLWSSTAPRGGPGTNSSTRNTPWGCQDWGASSSMHSVSCGELCMWSSLPLSQWWFPSSTLCWAFLGLWAFGLSQSTTLLRCIFGRWKCRGGNTGSSKPSVCSPSLSP